MPSLDPVFFGLSLLTIGVVLAVLTRFFVGLTPGFDSISSSQMTSQSSLLDIPKNQDAILIIQPGGRVVYINSVARDWFALDGKGLPNLEDISRRTRPRDSFFSLCATEGKVNFSIQDRIVEGTSYLIQHQGQRQMLVVLRRPQLSGIDLSEEKISIETLDILFEMFQAISASLELEATVEAILMNVERLIPSDYVELTLLDPVHQLLVPYRLDRGADSEQSATHASEPRLIENSLSGYLITYGKPLLIADMEGIDLFQPIPGRFRFPIKSYLGIPLHIAGEPIGTLELASLSRDVFTQGDLETLRYLSGQAAVAIHNANIHAAEEKRVSELASLAKLSQAVAAMSKPQDLFKQLAESIQPLLEVENLGFMTYDPTSQILKGEVPFVGIPDMFVENLRVQIEPDSLAAAFLSTQEIIKSQEAPLDVHWISLGLSDVARAAGMSNTALVPLSANGQSLGLLFVGNKQDGTPLNNEDLRKLTIIAGQAGPIIENATLIQETRRRTRQAEALRRIASLGGSSATLDEILKFSLLEIARLLSADAAAIFIINENQEMLELHDASLFGISPEVSQEIKPIPFDHPAFERLVTSTRRPFFSRDIQTDERDFPLLDAFTGTTTPFRSLMDVPLEVGERGFGEIVLASAQIEYFNHNDLQLAGSIAQHLAEAIERALSHKQLDLPGGKYRGFKDTSESDNDAQQQLSEFIQKNIEQTIALDKLTQAAHRTQACLSIAEMINRQLDRPSVLLALGEGLLEKMDFDLVLIADTVSGEPRLLHVLGNRPADSKPDSLLGQKNPLWETLQTSLPILVADLQDESSWQSSPLLNALGASAFICLPVKTGGTATIATLAIRHTPMLKFSPEDEQLINLLGSQVAITLENLDLIRETRQRLHKVGLMLDYSQQVGSLDPGEILSAFLQTSLKLIMNAQAGLVALWDQRRLRLIPQQAIGYANNRKHTQIHYRSGEALPGRALAEGKSIRLDEINFAAEYNLTSDDLLRYQGATGGKVPVSTLIVPLQTGDTTLGIILLDNFNTPAAFTQDDQALITSLAQQTTLGLENARLYQASEQRAAQLQVLTDVAATITSSLQTDELIASLLDQLQAIIPYETGTLWLRHKNHLAIKAASGFDENEQRIGLSVALEDSQLLNEMVASGKPINIENVHTDVRFPALTEHPYQSWLGIPLITKGEVIGVIALEKSEPGFYNAAHIQGVRTFAGQAVVALENAGLYEDSLRRTDELNQRTHRLDLLNRISVELSETLDPDNIVGLTIQELQNALDCSDVFAILLEGEDGAQLWGNSTGLKFDPPQRLPDAPLFAYLRESLGAVTTNDIESEPLLEPLRNHLDLQKGMGLLALPLATGQDLFGVILLQSSRNERFAPEEVEIASTICNQVAIAYQKARLFEETRDLKEDLEQRVLVRTEQLKIEHQRTKTLFNIITELSASLDLDIILNRTLALINDISGAEQSTILLFRPEEELLYHRASLGYTTPPPAGGKPSAIKPDQGLAGWVIKHKKPILIPNLLEDERWIQQGNFRTQHRSCMAVPLLIGEETLGTLMVFHREVNQFQPDLLDLIQATAQQIAVAINNAQLYRLIADQAERLGAMLRSQQIETSRSRAILESVADGVLVTDAQNIVTLYNASAERILSLDPDQVIDKPLEAFYGLFGSAAQSWMETIQNWSADPTIRPAEEIFKEQIHLDNGNVISVNLAPVILRDEYMGTVSIFRDITHLIEVDRLKSEFVAMVSHELRTPMTSIKGYVDVLLMGAAGHLNEKQTEFLQVVKTNTNRLNTLVNDLLDISRMEAGKVTLSVQPLNLPDIAEQIVQEMNQRTEKDQKTLHIDLRSAPKLPRVIGDPDRIYQILYNLVDNAYNYTPEDGQITVSIDQVSDSVQVQVQDTGIGIPSDDQKQVFERFFRGENPLVLGTAGTGLGLSIVQQLVEMHHGKIWLQSSGIPGEGTTFYFTLPIYQNLTRSSYGENIDR